MNTLCLILRKKGARFALMASLACCQLLPRQADKPRPLSPVRLTAGATTRTLHLWTACSAEEQARGLMGRRSLGGADGMLFVFDGARPRTFWMHDTPLALDMLFFDGTGRLTCCIEWAEPMTDTPRACPIPSQYVVELPGGAAARLSLGADTTLNKDDLAASCRRP